jgi:hypothetical protein
MHRSIRRTLPLLLLVAGFVACLGAPGGLRAAPPTQPDQPDQASGWFSSTQSVVSPLQPVPIQVSVAGFSGPAALLIFDGAGEAAGSWEFTIPPGGATTVNVVPRGRLGDHWAALFANGVQVASGTIYRLDAQTTIQTGVEPFDQLYPRVRGFMHNCILDYSIDGHHVHGYRSPDSPLLWLRDHYYQGRGFRYFEPDVTSLLDGFRRAQYEDGSFPDFVSRPEYGIPAFRTPVEADVEYLFVLAVYEAWQMTGDDAWLIQNLEAMQKALHYTLTHPIRWEPSVGLVKRPYTIDTWDFEYGPATIDPTTGNLAPRHWIDDQTIWGIFHGDNTGLAAALNALAHVETYLGQPEQAHYHRSVAATIMQHLNNLSWNGSFYTHHVKLQPWPGIPGLDEASQLSLSNALALNRGVLTTEQGRAIIEEYRSRLSRPDNVAFAEWWSIDPPFPPGSFGMGGRLGEWPGYYVNGGIMPLVGGELSRGAFRYGEERYGFDILHRYYDLIQKTGATYLWYHPTGGKATGRDVLPTDGWGSSAMLAALMEGAAGVEDHAGRYHDATLSPRWPAAGDETRDYPDVTDAYVVARYAASDAYVAYRWSLRQEGGRRAHLNLQATGTGAVLRLRLLLPAEMPKVEWVALNGQPVPVTIEEVGPSRYLVLNQVPARMSQVDVQLKR